MGSVLLLLRWKVRRDSLPSKSRVEDEIFPKNVWGFPFDLTDSHPGLPPAEVHRAGGTGFEQLLQRVDGLGFGVGS